MAQSILLNLPSHPSPIVTRAVEIFQRIVRERAGVPVTTSGVGDLTVRLAISPGIGKEAFRIDDLAGNVIGITGNDPRGLLYGIGKFLHASGYRRGEFLPGEWRGMSEPEKPVRGIYFATHFFNWYHAAPLEDITRYLEDLALWGINVLNVWFDMHHFAGIDDPAAQEMIARLHDVLKAANGVGLGASLLLLANEGYANSPAELRADWTAGHDGYHSAPQGHYHVELCPSKPGAQELLLRWLDEKLAAFADIDLEHLWIWPYDQGGCTCGPCAPWGVNGFLRLAEPIARSVRARFPRAKIAFSTWYFDRFTDGEWPGLTAVFRHHPDWLDYLVVDDCGDNFPRYPLTHGAPGGFPMLNFPEISMYAADPWAGYGANPFPHHLQAIWDSAKEHLAGGFPYSEGIYEDLNKVICAQFYWDADKPAQETVREYVEFTYGQGSADQICAAIEILEHTWPRSLEVDAEEPQIRLRHPAGVDIAFRLLDAADRQLDPAVSNAWRWRILYLRALIDAELVHHDFHISDRCEEAFQELEAIFHAENALDWVHPPTREMIRRKKAVVLPL